MYPDEYPMGGWIGAFDTNYNDLKSVTIPKSVKSINKWAFGRNSIETEGIGIDKPLTDITIICYSGSAAEQFANTYGFSYSIISHVSHNYTSTVIRPTYFDKGYTIHQCETCGEWYTSDHKDKLVLGTVSNFKAAVITSSTVKLTWDNVFAADGYIVYKYDNTKKTWVRVAKTTSNAYTVSKLSSATKYDFAVKAYKNVSGKEVTSKSYQTASATTKLAKVSKISSTSTANSVKLTWNKVSGAQGYIVYKYDNSKKTWVRVTKTTGNTYTVSKLSAGTAYKFTVKAYKTVNGKEMTSEIFDNYQTTTNPATVKFTLTAGSKKAAVKWSKVTGATGYIVYYKTSANGSWQKLTTTTGTSYTKTGLAKGKTYYFTVKAYRTYNGKTYNGSYTTKSVKIS